MLYRRGVLTLSFCRVEIRQMSEDSPEKHAPTVGRPLKFRRLNSQIALRRAKVQVLNAVASGKIERALANCLLFGLDGVGRTLEAESAEKLLEQQAALEKLLAVGSGGRLRLIGHEDAVHPEH
jgi:hypothetical protein